jgi:hypothetical protein
MDLAPSHAAYGTDPLIVRPIFVLGVPRSGTTLTLALMASHPDLAWSSQFTNRFPMIPELALYSRVLDVDALRRLLPTGSRLTPRPAEPYTMLNHVTDRAFTQPRLLGEEDVTSHAVRKYRRVVRQHLHWQGKSRYLQKHTGFPRIRYLQTIFPDARFIHVLRDGRAVSSSLEQVGFFDGTADSWWWGPMRPEFEQEYVQSGRSPIVLAAITWKTLVDLIEPAMAELPPHRGMTVRYDRLIARPEDTMAEVAEFCELEWSPAFSRRMSQIRVAGSDDKWKRLPPKQQRDLEGVLRGHLDRLGFD